MNKLLTSFVLLLICSCASSNNTNQIPSWYGSPKQNDSTTLYGVAQGKNPEEATKYALVDASSRLTLTISSESNLLREENSKSSNEELRQKVRQNIEKISFTGFRTTRSAQIGTEFFTEVAIPRDQFISEQQEQIKIITKKISDLDHNSLGKNAIQRRNALIKIIELGKELELKARIVSGAGENINLSQKLEQLTKFQNEFEKTSDKLEFVFGNNSSPEINKIIRNALNKEKIKIAQKQESSREHQVIILINSETSSNKIYEAFMTKLKIDFENLVDGKILASNSIEVSGSSSISYKESYKSALATFEEKVSQDGVLKILRITN